MPILSRFYGIVIRMYFQQAEHNPPHIHALYGDDMAEIVIRTGGSVGRPSAAQSPCHGARMGVHQQK